jgi:activator of HSP90 ATPase
LTFKDLGDKTEITLMQSGIPIAQDAELRQGWTDFYWEPLKDCFGKPKGHDDEPGPLEWFIFFVA